LGQVHRIYHGIWGSAPFQRIYQTGPTGVLSALLMPEWYLGVAALGCLTLLAWNWEPLRIVLPTLILAAAAPIVQAWRSAGGAAFPEESRSGAKHLGLRLLTTSLYILQPIARLSGRMGRGLSPWRKHAIGFCPPRLIRYQIWSEDWRPPAQWMEAVEQSVRAAGTTALRGGEFDRWDLEVPGGIFGSCRVRMAVEEHGAGRQLVRLRSWPRSASLILALVALLAGCAVHAGLNGALAPFAFLTGAAAITAFKVVQQCGAAMAAIDCAVQKICAARINAIAVQQVRKPMGAQTEAP
jgi:hypothetical protein